MDKFKKLNEESNIKVINLQSELQEKDAQLVQAQISMTNFGGKLPPNCHRISVTRKWWNVTIFSDVVRW